MRDPRRIVIVAMVLAMLGLAVGLCHAAAQRRAAALLQADPEMTLTDPMLRETALDLGRVVYARRCAGCHGATGVGNRDRGAPDLTDGDVLYGSGSVAEIEQIVLHGIRSGRPKGWNLASMPAYGTAQPYRGEPIPPLRPGEIADVAAYLRALRGLAADPDGAARGKVIYGGKGGCYDCHGADAGGDPAIGAPNLLDDVWLYGDGSDAALRRSIAGGRGGIMPGLAGRIGAADARAVAAYAAALRQHNGGSR